MMRMRQGQFDLTPVAYVCAIIFLVYFCTLPFAWFLVGAKGWSWSALIFPVLALALLLDLRRGLRRGEITVTQVVGYRFAGVLMVAGALFGAGERWAAPAVTAVLCVGLFAWPAKGAQPSHWVPPPLPTVSLRRRRRD